MKKLVLSLDKDNDKRKKKRIEIFSNISGQLDVLGVSSDAIIKDISYSGFGVIIPNDSRFATMETLEAKLALSNQLFTGRIANKVILPNQKLKLGISLPNQVQREIDFNTQDSSWDNVTDLETVKNIYGDLAFRGPESPIELKQNFSRATLLPMEITQSGTMICEIFQIHFGNLDKGKARCTFDLFQTCHAFDSNIDRFDQTKIEIKLSPTLARLLRRETVRVKNANSKFETSILLRSKSLNKEISEFQIYDYSEHGLSLLDPNGDLSLPRNLLFEEIIIQIKDIGSIFGYGEVRSYEWNRSLNSNVIGLLFKPYGEPHLTNWHNFILKTRYPNLDFDYEEEDHKKIWFLFETSNYLGLKPRESFNYVYDISRSAWEKLKESGTEFSKRILIRNNEDIVGHMQFDRIYPSTWCAHALAIDPSHTKLVGKELYSVVADIFSTEQARYTVSITETELTWNQKNYYDFVKNYPFPEHNEIKIFQIHEAEMGVGWNLETNPDITINESNKYDLAYISRYFEVNLSKIEVKALGYDSDLELIQFNKELSKYGLNRARKFLIATYKGDRIGFSVMESGTTGLSIFGIQDTMYIFLDDTKGADRTIVYNTILNESLNYYKNLNVPTVNIYMEEKNREYYSERGIKFVWEGSRWITYSDVSKRYHAHTQMLYGHLILRREKIRMKNRK